MPVDAIPFETLIKKQEAKAHSAKRNARYLETAVRFSFNAIPICIFGTAYAAFNPEEKMIHDISYYSFWPVIGCAVWGSNKIKKLQETAIYEEKYLAHLNNQHQNIESIPLATYELV